MSEKTNQGLADWARRALAEGWRYWYGTVGYKCTLGLLERKREQYPDHYTADRQARYLQDISEGRTCCDCINLFKAYMWDENGKSVYASNGCPDTNANGMFARAKEKGAMDTMPDIPGLMVRFDGHAGVYVGDGLVIEARGFRYGVVQTKLAERPWTNWYRPHCLLYTEDGAPMQARAAALGERVLRRGMAGEDVRELQEALLKLKYNLGVCGADGEYGPVTARAVSAMQLAGGALSDGIYGPESHRALMAMLGDLHHDAAGEAEDADERTDTQTTAQASEAEAALVVTGEKVNVRSGPGTHYGILTVARKGARLACADSDGWAAVRLGEAVGWISKDYVESEARNE